VRRFLKGETGLVGKISQRLQGSPDLYAWGGRGTCASINFITFHDGFTLMDLVSYDGKHNEANGENNNDGGDDNFSWNCGWEGPTEAEGINFLRRKQIKNAVAMLLVSQGVPMILAGDEIGNTQWGNNNAYCQDSDISWMDWSLLEKNQELFHFFRKMIAFRHAHPALRNRYHFQNKDYKGSGYPDISWHGLEPWNADFSESSLCIAFMLDGAHAKGGFVSDNTIYVGINMHWEPHYFGLPGLPEGVRWHVFANTGIAGPVDAWEVGSEPPLENQGGFMVESRSIFILIGK
jgi:glycogen operon protein